MAVTRPMRERLTEMRIGPMRMQADIEAGKGAAEDQQEAVSNHIQVALESIKAAERLLPKPQAATPAQTQNPGQKQVQQTGDKK